MQEKEKKYYFFQKNEDKFKEFTGIYNLFNSSLARYTCRRSNMDAETRVWNSPKSLWKSMAA